MAAASRLERKAVAERTLIVIMLPIAIAIRRVETSTSMIVNARLPRAKSFRAVREIL